MVRDVEVLKAFKGCCDIQQEYCLHTLLRKTHSECVGFWAPVSLTQHQPGGDTVPFLTSSGATTAGLPELFFCFCCCPFSLSTLMQPEWPFRNVSLTVAILLKSGMTPSAGDEAESWCDGRGLQPISPLGFLTTFSTCFPPINPLLPQSVPRHSKWHCHLASFSG